MLPVLKKIIFVIVFSILFLGCSDSTSGRKDTNVFGGCIIVCIEGNSYYQEMRGGIAIKLDDNGKPVKCVK